MRRPRRAIAGGDRQPFSRSVERKNTHDAILHLRHADARGPRRKISGLCASIMSTCVTIESLEQEGRGVARVEGKAVFVEGALPGEQVRIETLKKKPAYEIARVVAIDKPSASRVTPQCPHFGVCGGCTLQHADLSLQVAAKQRTLEDALERIGRVKSETLLPPIAGSAWHYRYRARLSVRHV